jgi:hypothetical protein
MHYYIEMHKIELFNHDCGLYYIEMHKIDLFSHDCGLHRILVVKSITKDEENISSWMGTLVK